VTDQPAQVPLGKGRMRFYDTYIPALEVGDYLINVVQQINPNNTAINESHAAAQVFSVQGPRYTLPSDDIFSVFPPNDSVGIFDQSLPQVVLAKRDLPWERNVFNDYDEAQQTQTPWLALLLFFEGEQIGGHDALLEPAVDHWQPNRMRTAAISAAALYNHGNSGADTLWPALTREWYESDEFLKATSCSVIDVSREAFALLVPKPADLRYLSHVREVNASSKDSEVLKIAEAGWYSILIGNRLPDPPDPAAKAAGGDPSGRRNIAHLVSLEGLQDYAAGKQALPANIKRVRMLSLKSWSFVCVPELGESFSDLANALLAPRPGLASSTAFMLPAAPPAASAEAQYAAAAVGGGYVPLNYDTRLGDRTAAWYRGPFSPVPVTNFISAAQRRDGDEHAWQPFSTASSALIYDKSTGLFDVSYAVAWETGRLMALADAHFAGQLLDWQRRGHTLIDRIMERRDQVAALSAFDPQNPDHATEDQILDLIKNHAVSDAFIGRLTAELSEQLGQVTTDAQRPPVQGVPPAKQSLGDLINQPKIADAVREIGGQELDAIADWLAQRYLLAGVPFENMVPSPALLPPESIRFFYVDTNWLDALVEGALSIGIETSRDRLYQDLLKDLIWDATFAALRQIRNKLLTDVAGIAPAALTAAFDQSALSGMLLRSTLVSGWPGLQVDAYERCNADGTGVLASHIPLLRMERVANDILLCLWPAVPAVACVEEPHEGIAFGFEDPPHGKGNWLYLRSLAGGDYGTPLQTTIDIDAAAVVDANRLVKISASGGLLDLIRDKLVGKPALRARDFAVQMIKVPEQVLFAVHTQGGP
jgi:hypothetical protein